jgi:hypothetical protein
MAFYRILSLIYILAGFTCIVSCRIVSLDSVATHDTIPRARWPLNDKISLGSIMTPCLADRRRKRGDPKSWGGCRFGLKLTNLSGADDGDLQEFGRRSCTCTPTTVPESRLAVLMRTTTKLARTLP